MCLIVQAVAAARRLAFHRSITHTRFGTNETHATDRLGIVLDHRGRMIMLIMLMGVE